MAAKAAIRQKDLQRIFAAAKQAGVSAVIRIGGAVITTVDEQEKEIIINSSNDIDEIIDL